MFHFFCLSFIYDFIYVWLFFFFFQAEDGIRDIGVTGVQTCALPICKARVLRELLHDEAESPLSKVVARLSWPVVHGYTEAMGCVEPAEVADTTVDYVARNVPKGSASTAESPSKQPETIDKQIGRAHV